MAGCSLTNGHVVSLLNDSQSREPLFPSLVTLLLSDNDISEEGTSALFENGLPHLSYLKVNRNFNPNFLNILLSYATKLH